MKIRRRNFYSKYDIEQAALRLGCDLAGIKIMSSKAIFQTLEVQGVSIQGAIICKQEMMALGGEVILSREVMTLLPKTTTMLICGTEKQYKKLSQKLYQQPFGCKEMATKLTETIGHIDQKIGNDEWNVRTTTLTFSKPLIMGIANITPDSFSDGNMFLHKDAAIQHCKKMIKEGADILDLGAESSRPGSDPVSAEEELQRLLPVLQAILGDPSISIPISIDTYKPEVARACLEAGAHMINDITGVQDPRMQDIVAKYQCPVIMMHMQGKPKTMQNNPEYNDVVDDIIDFFEQQIRICGSKGITKIICDPGIGFGKTVQQNLQIINRLKEFKILGKPLLIGTSRKSFIGKTIGGEAQDRLEGTVASNVIAAMHGCHIFRVHDVKACKRALELTKMISDAKQEK
jgi:dihydropteroate synthase